jgi:hypothetical protein
MDCAAELEQPQDRSLWDFLARRGSVVDRRGEVATLARQRSLERRFRMSCEDCYYWNDNAANLESITVPAYVVTDIVTDLHRIGTCEGLRRVASSEKWSRFDDRQEWPDQYDPRYEHALIPSLSRWGHARISGTLGIDTDTQVTGYLKVHLRFVPESVCADGPFLHHGM